MTNTIVQKTLCYFPVALVAILAIAFSQSSCDKLVTETTVETRFDSTTGAACLTCHTDQNDSILVIPNGQWVNSAHADPRLIEASVALNGGNYQTNVCGPACHSGNGYVGSVTSGGSTNQRSTIGCFSCHLPHTGAYGTWRMDTLRGDTSAIVLKDVNGQTASYTMGESNMCARCHQAVSVPTIASVDSVALIDRLFGPHAAPQANLLAGVGGFLFTPGAVTNSHNSVANATQDGCLSCHFRPGSGYELGEHSFALRNGASEHVASCNVIGCHINAPITDLDNIPRVDSVKQLLDSLKRRLAAQNVIDTTDPTGLSIDADTSRARDLVKILHNYLMVKQDGSNGVHNALYALRLLKESLARIDSIPVARFVHSTDTICFDDSVHFADSSTGSVERRFWTFGDNGTSTERNPWHTFQRPGIYSVNLTVTGFSGSSTTRQTNIVFVDTTHARIGIPPGTFVAGQPINFSDSSTGRGISSWTWDFGDQSVTDDTSSAQNPVYTYQNDGLFTVSLTVTGECGSGTITRAITVNPAPPSPPAAKPPSLMRSSRRSQK